MEKLIWHVSKSFTVLMRTNSLSSNKGNLFLLASFLLKNIFITRFVYLSNAQDTLDKETFRENMGLLGLDSGSFLADRIFAVLDVDKDGKVYTILPPQKAYVNP